MVGIEMSEVDHLRPSDSTGWWAHCVEDDFVVKVTDAEKYLIRDDIALQILLAKTMAPYGCSDPNCVPRGEVYFTTGEFVVTNVDRLLLLNPEQHQFSGSLSALA
ncbi:hypothetical protein HPB48_020634 [Haemaphysalis longicornis]|uniref:Uncharacterized protein n=1 Tax=Haemaphysalis longicornis TaxID=44386 RepID=A0A9J6G9H2_HAELO|nr:hypothetical protein HPB48_020634 [Haemaphysalis longicornis]